MNDRNQSALAQKESNLESGTDAAIAPATEGARSAYSAPRCERLGRWTALTLQQSVILFP